MDARLPQAGARWRSYWRWASALAFCYASLLGLLPSSATHAQGQAEPAAPAENAQNPDAGQAGNIVAPAPKGVPEAPHQLARSGQFIIVEQPINDGVDKMVRRMVDQVITRVRDSGKWPVIVLELRPGKSELGAAVDLARFLESEKLHGATTVAYIPETLTGHAVLVAMACDEIVMDEKARFGEAGKDLARVTDEERIAYLTRCRNKRTLPEAIALGMLDPDVEVHLAETPTGSEYVLADQLKNRRSKGVVKPLGELGMYTAADARARGFAKLLVRERQEVAEAYGLPNDALVADPSAAGGWQAVRIDFKGPAANRASQVAKAVQDAAGAGKNLIVIRIDSPGGSAEECVSLAQTLLALDPRKHHTVAYIPRQALADAALVALACDRILIHPDAEFGGPGAGTIDLREIDAYSFAAGDIADQKSRSGSLASAIIDPQLSVYRYERDDGVSRYLSEKAVRGLPDAERWKQGVEVTTPGKPFHMNGREAVETYEMCSDLVQNFAEVKALYGLEADPQLAEPGWVDTLIEALARDEVKGAMLALGVFALLAEIHGAGMGIGLGWLVSGLCFMLFFWVQFLGGTAGWLEVLLFFAGVCCLLLEIFVLPGFGLFGLAGGGLVLISLILASQTFVLPQNDYQMWQLTRSLLMMCGAGVAVAAAAALLRQYLPYSPFYNRLVLAPPTVEELRGQDALYAGLVGQRGRATTPLAPSGKVRIGDRTYDVVAEGTFLDRGAEVVVTEVLGNRIVVKPLTA